MRDNSLNLTVCQSPSDVRRDRRSARDASHRHRQRALPPLRRLEWPGRTSPAYIGTMNILVLVLEDKPPNRGRGRAGRRGRHGGSWKELCSFFILHIKRRSPGTTNQQLLLDRRELRHKPAVESQTQFKCARGREVQGCRRELVGVLLGIQGIF